MRPSRDRIAECVLKVVHDGSGASAARGSRLRGQL